MYLWNFIPHCHFLSHVSIFLFHHVSCEDDSGMYTCKIPQYLHETAMLFYSWSLSEERWASISVYMHIQEKLWSTRFANLYQSMRNLW